MTGRGHERKSDERCKLQRSASGSSAKHLKSHGFHASHSWLAPSGTGTWTISRGRPQDIAYRNQRYFKHARLVMASEDEDDYMSMVIEDPKSRIKESSIQKAARLKKEVGELIGNSCLNSC
jgi:hypothetical protein